MKPTQTQIKLALAYAAPEGHLMRKYSAPKPRRKPQRREALLQEAVCQYLDTQPRILYWANNPQVFIGKMTPQKMNYLAGLKKRGFKKGVPDLCLLFADRVGRSVFCFVELKSLEGTATEEQTGMMIACEQRGGFTAIVKSVEDLIVLLEESGFCSY